MVVWASLLFPSTGSGNWGEGGWGFFVVPFDRLRELEGRLRELVGRLRELEGGRLGFLCCPLRQAQGTSGRAQGTEVGG